MQEFLFQAVPAALCHAVMVLGLSMILWFPAAGPCGSSSLQSHPCVGQGATVLLLTGCWPQRCGCPEDAYFYGFERVTCLIIKP